MDIVDEILYFQSLKGRKSTICSVDFNSFNNIKIIVDDVAYAVMFDKNIFFNKSKITDDNLYSIDINTLEVKIISEIFLMFGYATIYDGWIYYINMKDKKSMYKIRIDGTANTKIYNGDNNYISNITIYDNSIYFKKDSSLYKISNNIVQEVIKSQSNLDFNIYNNYIIHSSRNPKCMINDEILESETYTKYYSLYITDLKFGDTKLLTTELASDIQVIDGVIYYYTALKNQKLLDLGYGVNRSITINGTNQTSL